MSTNKLIYKGAGKRFVPGVPSRDLTEEEVKALPPEILKQAIETGVFEGDLPEKLKKEAADG